MMNFNPINKAIECMLNRDYKASYGKTGVCMNVYVYMCMNMYICVFIYE